MTFTPTPEQQAIIAAARDTSDNLIVSALAGAAKTSTLELIAEALPKTNMICLAFNKAIAQEMEARLPSNCTCMTINSLGHRVWAQKLGTRLRLNKSKMYGIFQALMEKLVLEADKEEAFSELSSLLKAAGTAKAIGHLPDKFIRSLSKPTKPLVDDYQLINEELNEDFSPLCQSILLDALFESAVQSMQGTIDFGDQVLFPSLFKCMYPIYSLILIDEAQDLSPLNHAMLSQLYRKRIIAVGDQCQAIYAFRGAFEEGMASMQRQFNCIELPLSVSFRCPEEIVDHVRWRAPHMQSWPGTPAGKISRVATWDYSIFPETCAIICRNNAPLLSVAIGLLKVGRYPNLWGNDIAAGLVKDLKSLGPDNMQQSQALLALADWHEVKKKKLRNQNMLQDRVDCLRIFITHEPTLGQAAEYANFVFSSTGRIDLMTGHKSKGHEFNDVFFLDEQLVGNEGQELNLRYVICTRAKRNLTYIESKGLIKED